MVALDLLELLGPSALAVHAFGPGDEALVQTCTCPLQEAAVCRVLDEDMHEAERRVFRVRGGRGSHELLAAHGLEIVGHLGSDPCRDELLDGGGRELLADHRCWLDHGAFALRKQVEAGGEQRLNGGRHDHLG